MVIKFKTKEGYRKWNAYRYIHGLAKGGRQKILIGGRVHKVKHIWRKK